MKNLASITFFLLLLSLAGYGQKKGVYSSADQATATALSSGSLQVNLPQITLLDKNIKKATLILSTDFGGDYVFGNGSAGTSFDWKIDFTLRGLANSSQVFSQNLSLRINNKNPEGSFAKDLLDRAVTPAILTPTGFDIDQVQVTGVTLTDLQSGGSFPLSQSLLQLKLLFSIEYGLKVNSLGNEILAAPPLLNASGKSMLFSWTATNPYPEYQFELLRLFNKDVTKNTDQSITADVDWTKATRIETESDAKNLRLTIAEGTGFYAWRVRPIGGYYPGGMSNSSNWGSWNSGAPLGGSVLVLPQPANASVFFFLDPDDTLNYQYSRIFTEENKVKESATYANKLLQQKQAQVFVPSDNTTMITQTVQDYVGRPALKTLPAPSTGELSGYKKGYVKSGTELYSEKHFDSDAKLNAPDPVSGTSAPSQYYNGTGNVASSEGYPYSRVLFYNDGSGRVKEESGVGKTHMIGDTAAGMGRTVKTFYSTPSQDELWAFFGKEAPNNESVQKTITVDQNNVASITYKGKDGKVIATAMAFLEQENNDLLPLNENNNVVAVKDKVTGNVVTPQGYISSRRVVFTEPTPIAFEYFIECIKLDGLCANIEVDCGYSVKIVVHNLDNPTLNQIFTASLTGRDCVNSSACGKSGQYITLTTADFQATGVTLPAGTYVIEKILSATRDISVTLADQERKTRAQIDPIKNWIQESLKNVKCPFELEVFYANLYALSGLFASQSIHLGSNPFCLGCTDGITVDQDFMDIYAADPSAFSVTIITKNGVIPSYNPATPPIGVVIKTACCQDLPLLVTYVPPFKCPPASAYRQQDVNNNGKIDVNYQFLTNPAQTEYYPDFEGYAISLMSQCSSVDSAKTILYDGYLQGWKEGDFNKMVYHMLTDVYSCDGKGANASQKDTLFSSGVDSNDVCTPPADQQVPGTQYTCKELSKCWSQIVLMISRPYCPEASYLLGQSGSTSSVSDGVDEQNGGDQSTHDDHEDEGGESMGWFFEKIFGGKISKAVRDMQSPPSVGGDNSIPADQIPVYVFHGVDQFLNCTGYRFAYVLEPDTMPCSANGSGVVIDTSRMAQELWTDFDGDTTNGEYRSCPYKLANLDSVKVQMDTATFFSQPKADSKYYKDLFPYLKNPIYAFKYFEYAKGTFPALEAGNCFEDPNDCYQIVEVDSVTRKKVTLPCCNLDVNAYPCVLDPAEYLNRNYDTDGNGSYKDTIDQKYLVRNFCYNNGGVKCPYVQKDWTCGQRLQFYMTLKFYRVPPAMGKNYSNNLVNADFMTSTTPLYPTNKQIKDSTGLDYANASIWLAVTGTAPSVPAVSLPGLGSKNGDSSTYKSPVSYLEYQATKKRFTCENRCDQRKEEFTVAVYQMLADNCYELGDCKRSDQDNIFYEEDADSIVAQMIRQCKGQCELTTYTLENTGCRDFKTPLDIIGNTNNDLNLVFGAGGSNTFIPGDCPKGTTQMNSCCTNVDVSGKTLDGVPCNPLYTLSKSELTKYRQATEWFVELKTKSMCDSSGRYVDANNDGEIDDYPVYYYTSDLNTGEKKLVPQLPSDLNCQDNPVVGDTFVPEPAYLKNPNLPLNVQSPDPGTKVDSPKVGIIIDSE